MKSVATRVAIIGGGLGGLAAACTLAARGYAVTLYEANSWLGGKAVVHQRDGFRFDMGPTILTIPSVLRRIFAESGRKMEEYLDLVRLDPQWRCFFEDGSVLDLLADQEAMSHSIAAFTRDDQASNDYARFMSLSTRLRRISERFFFWRPIGSVRDMFDARSSIQLSVLGDVMRMRFGCSVAGTVRSFVKDARVAQMLDHFTQYVGSAPDASPAVLCGIAQMQTADGIWYPVGGIGAVPRALARLAGELGVTIHTGVVVRRIVSEGGRVRGLVLHNEEFVAFDAVVSNMDSVRTHRELLEDSEAGFRFDRRHRNPEPACSGVVLYLGLNQAYDHLLHHNFVFSRDPEAEFRSIYRDGEPAPDPTCYVCCPARSESAVAPAGGEAMYVLVHTPYLRPHHDWKRMLPDYRERILSKLEHCAGLKDLRARIIFESALTPRDLHDRYRVLNGAIYGLASHGKWLGAFKPNNRSSDLQGLYLAGGAAHPGPGMPMVLMSGWIAADALDQDQTRSRDQRPSRVPQRA